MDSGLATVLAATITGAFALLAVLVNKVRKENKSDHAYVQGLLTILTKSTSRIENKVDRVGERLSNHLEFHIEKGSFDDRSTDQNGFEGNC